MSPWVEDVMEFTAVAQAKDLDPLAWAIHVSSIVGPAGVELPSPEIAELLVRHAFSSGSSSPTSWKYLEKAISSNLAPPALVIALLSIRVIPKRHAKPAAYRLYMEILRRHLFTFSSDTLGPNYSRVFTLIYDILGLSQIVLTCDPGVIMVEFVLCIIWQLLDAALVDEGLMQWYLDKRPKWLGTSCAMEIDTDDSDEKHIVEYSDKLPQSNTVMSIELIAQCLHDARISRLLILAHGYMQLDWESFSLCLRLLAEKSSALRISRISPDFFLDNLSKNCKKFLPVLYKEFCAISSGLPSTDGHAYGSNHSSLWIPLDIFLEDAINGSIAATNSTEVLYDLVKALQAVNKISWNDTFLNLWLAALRLVQRERDLSERPHPDTDIRMSILLSVVSLTVADLVEDEIVSNKRSSSINIKEKNFASERAEALVSCLQMLGEYEALLAPPISVVSAANQAAGKAMVILSGIPIGSNYLDISVDDKTIRCNGNLRHLIVEACIARNLLDTSAYYWPGYVNGEMSPVPQSIPSQISWSALVQGAPLTSLMSSTLANTPAPSLADIERVFEIAISGLPDERIRAASVLCGASLIRGWNFQEHTVFFVVRLLSPSVPVDYSDSKSHLINHAPLLNVVLTGISSMDCVHIFSLYGLVPELAGSLMPICEAFGSCSPDIAWTLPTGEAITVYTVFSNAFVLLLRLWKFNHSPLEYCFLGENAPLGSKLNPDYLLFLRNLDVLSFGSSVHKKINRERLLLTGVNSQNSIVLDSFPKLKVWYQQHQACLASPLSGLLSGTPVRKNVDCLLNIMFTRINDGGRNDVGSATTGSSSVSSSSAQPRDEGSFKPKLTAWDIMEAVPFVVDASLTACSCGRLSPREFVTGLKYLVDFLPASLGAIVSYFTAEVTRGVWKPAFMNGTDWPSPAANLATVEEHIKKIVAATGVDVPRVKTGNSPAMLPLPLAAFLSLTITYNLDKSSELNLVGPALENLATSCPWPSMPIVSALWAQKVKRWSYYLTFSASGTVFYHNNNAAVQLLKSCFSAVLGLSNSSIYSGGGVWSLLGNGFDPNVASGLSPVAPGLLYLEVHRKVRDISLLSGEILSTLMSSVRELASDSLSKDVRKTKQNSKFETRYGQVSLFSVLTKAKPAASLAAILIWLSGGSGLIQGLFHELLPSWFLSAQCSDRGGMGSTVAMLEGYTLAYFAVLCGMFAWGIDSSRSSKRRPKIIGAHLKFLADALDGKVVLGCSWATYKAYVTEFLGLLVECAPVWIAELELGLLKKIALGLKTWNEKELAIRILERAGTPAIGAAAEFIINGK